MWERALAFNPQMAEALYSLGVTWGEAAEFDKAIFFFELCVAFCPTCAEAYNYLGIVYKVGTPYHAPPIPRPPARPAHSTHLTVLAAAAVER